MHRLISRGAQLHPAVISEQHRASQLVHTVQMEAIVRPNLQQPASQHALMHVHTLSLRCAHALCRDRSEVTQQRAGHTCRPMSANIEYTKKQS